jgi:hypothetical protein
MKVIKHALESIFAAVLIWIPLSATAASYTCSYVEGCGPIIDGRIMGDPFWEDVPCSNDLVLLGAEGKPSPSRTWFKIAYTKEALYVGAWCQEPNMNKLKTNSAFGEIWEDDSIEVFIAPPSIEPYLHLVVNTGGERYNAEGQKGVNPLPWKSVCAKEDGAYSIEICLPYTTLLAAPRAGECWIGNIGRNQYTGSKSCHSTWGRLPGGFHDRLNFAILFFPVGIDCPEAEKAFFEKFSKKLYGEFDGNSSGFNSILKLMDHGRFDVRLLCAEKETLGRLSGEASILMISRLKKEWGKLMQRAESMRGQNVETEAQNRLAALFKN